VRLDLGDAGGAESCLLRLLRTPPGQYFASMDTGLAGYKARHNLAVIYQQQGRRALAQEQWRAAVAEQPTFVPGWLGLAEEMLRQSQWEELEQVAGSLEPLAGAEAALVRARGHMARQEWAAAQELLRETAVRWPTEVRPRLLLGHALLQEGRDWEAAEAALRAVLALDPGHAETRHNLALLLQQQGRAA
jgi:tetratricopeptide (TPR) repeat protein